MRVVHWALFLFLLAASDAIASSIAAPCAPAAEPCAPATPGEQAAGIEVKGRIIDGDGVPIAGAVVGLLSHPSRYAVRQAWSAGASMPPQIVVTSGEDGRFVLRAPGAGMWVVTARSPRHAEKLVFVRPLVQHADVFDIALPAVRPVRVRVTGPDGQPVAGATIFAQAEHSTATNRRSSATDRASHSSRAAQRSAVIRRARNRAQLRARLARTDAEGWARLDVVDDRASMLKVVAEGFLPAEKRHRRGPQAAITLDAGKPRIIEVARATGTPVADALLVLDGQSPPIGKTDSAGRVVVTVPANPTLVKKPLPVYAYAADGSTGSVSIGSAEGEDAEKPVRLSLVEPAILRGTVVDAIRREPVAGAVVWGNAAEQVSALSDARGGFSLRVPGVVSWLSAGAADYLLAGMAVQGSRPTTLVLAPAGRLAGRVIDEHGEPLAGVAVDVSNRSPAAWQGHQSSAAAVSDRNGAFELAPLPVAVSLRVVASREGFAPREAEAMVPREGDPEPLEITLLSGIRAMGTVVDTADQPLVGARVSLFQMPMNQQGFRAYSRMHELEPLESTTDSEGRFRFEDLGAGRYVLGVAHQGHAPVHVPGIAVDGSDRVADFGTVIMLDGAVLDGRVVDADGGPIAEASVVVHERQGGRGYLDRRQEPPKATSGSDGRFTVSDLRPEAPVDVVVQAEGFVPAQLANVKVPSAEPLRIVMAAGVDLQGVVVNSRGNGIRGAAVLATLGGSLAQGRRMGRVRDAEGTFVVENLVPGDWSLVVSADGFVTREVPPVVVTAGEKPPAVRVQLDTGATLSGRVTVSDGSPLPNASVSLRMTVRDPMRAFRNHGATTDGDGYYELSGLPLGRHAITFGHARYQSLVRDLELSVAALELDVTLEAGLEIAGQVVDPDGMPVAGALVSANAVVDASTTRFYGGSGGGMRETDTQGRFRLEGLGAGAFHVTAAKDGYASAVTETPVQLSDSSFEGLELRLSAGGKVAGLVRGVAFDDLASVSITAMRTDGRASMQPQIVGVDHEGRFELANLSVGDWQVYASVGQRSEREVITIPAAGAEVSVELNFGSGFTLTGVVLEGGAPAPGLGVSARGVDTQGYAQETSSPRGRFELPGLAAGRYELTVGGHGRFGRPLDRREIEIHGDEDIVIEIQTVAVTGRVVDAIGSLPVPGASIRVSLDAEHGATTVGSWQMRDAVSGDDGTFRIGEVAPGAYQLRVEKEGFAAAVLALEVAADGTSAGIEVMLERAAGLRLQAILPTGLPAGEVTVAVLDPAGQAIVLANQVADASGYIEVEQVPRGRWDLLVASAGAATANVKAEVPGPPVQVVLEPAGRLLIRVPVVREGGLAHIALADDQGKVRLVSPYGLLFERWTAADGQATIGPLAPGPIEVTVSLSDGSTLRGTTQVVADQTTELELR